MTQYTACNTNTVSAMKIKHRVSRKNKHSKQILHYTICLQVVICLPFYAYEDTKILCDILRKTGRL